MEQLNIVKHSFRYFGLDSCINLKIHKLSNKDTAWWDRLFGQIYLRRQEATKRLKLNLPGSRADRPIVEGVPTKGPLVETFCGFSSYEDGKMIVRLNRHLPPPIPNSKHSYLADNGLMLQEVYQASKSDDAVILHYPNAGMTNWRRRWGRLGRLKLPRLLEMDGQFLRIVKKIINIKKGNSTSIHHNDHNDLAVISVVTCIVRICSN